MYFILVVVSTVHDKKIRGKIIFKNRGKNQNLKNKIPRTGALRSFFKNENYNFDS